MEDSLSKQYLLYLRDMSRKVVYGASGSAGDYSQVLIRGSKQKQGRSPALLFLVGDRIFIDGTPHGSWRSSLSSELFTFVSSFLEKIASRSLWHLRYVSFSFSIILSRKADCDVCWRC